MKQTVVGATGEAQIHKDRFQVTHRRKQQPTTDPRGNENIESFNTVTEPTYEAIEQFLTQINMKI